MYNTTRIQFLPPLQHQNRVCCQVRSRRNGSQCYSDLTTTSGGLLQSAQVETAEEAEAVLLRFRKISHQLLALSIGMTCRGSHPSSSFLRNPSCIASLVYVGISIQENSQRSGRWSITVSFQWFLRESHGAQAPSAASWPSGRRAVCDAPLAKELEEQPTGPKLSSGTLTTSVTLVKGHNSRALFSCRYPADWAAQAL
jgi:hypothetical protein